MASTYTLISSQVLASSASTVTFSSIPATYTNLVVRCSVRSATSSGQDYMLLQFNGDTATNYSMTMIYTNATTATSYRTTSTTSIDQNPIDLSTNTASTFSNNEFYIPSYLSTTSRPMSHFGVAEGNVTTNAAWMAANAGLYRGTSAITSLTLTDANGGSGFAATSSFYLYGIKSS